MIEQIYSCTDELGAVPVTPSASSAAQLIQAGLTLGWHSGVYRS